MGDELGVRCRQGLDPQPKRLARGMKLGTKELCHPGVYEDRVGTDDQALRCFSISDATGSACVLPRLTAARQACSRARVCVLEMTSDGEGLIAFGSAQDQAIRRGDLLDTQSGRESALPSPLGGVRKRPAVIGPPVRRAEACHIHAPDVTVSHQPEYAIGPPLADEGRDASARRLRHQVDRTVNLRRDQAYEIAMR